MVSVFTEPDVNTCEVGRTLDKLRVVVSYAYLVFSQPPECLHQGYVNTETILHFFNIY